MDSNEATTQDKYPRVYITDSENERTCAYWNGLGDERYRKFCIIIDKHDGTCTLFVENILGEVLNQQAFHVSAYRGRWGKGNCTPFVANDDARTIELRMAYTFKPMLLKMGMRFVPDTIFYEVRKQLNIPMYLLTNVKQSN